MGHIEYGTTRSSHTPHEWLGVGRMVGRLTNEWSRRTDIIGYVGPDAGQGAPACFNPTISEVELNLEKAFGKGATPEEVGDLTDSKTQYRYPAAIGALMHEAYHARYSLWDVAKAADELPEKVVRALHLLEEGRIEAHGIADNPDHRVFIRASALDLAIADAEEELKKSSEVRHAAFLVGLVHARIEAGVLEEDEVLNLTILCDTLLGAKKVDQLRDVIRKFQAHDTHDQADPTLYRLAERWVAIVEDIAKEAGEEEGGKNQESGDGPKSSGAGEMLEALKEALQEVRDTVRIANQDALADQEQTEDWEGEVKERASQARDRQIAERTAQKIFGSDSGPESFKGTSSTLVETRQPTSSERSAAVVISRMLEKAKYRERDLTEVASVTPPGRLRTRAIVQARALEARGVRQQVEPWRKNVRKQTEEPNLTVGVMVDISGSMRSAMEPMATTAWVMSEAVRRVQGRTAMVYFGSAVFPTLKPGQHLKEVRVYTAADSTEEFETAFRALDGGLNLLHGSGARMLVIVSDGNYRYEMDNKVKEALRDCKKAGVPILWLPFSSMHGVRPFKNLADIALLEDVKSPTDAAMEIGKQAARLLELSGNRAR